jgi:signal transduction histidine kinase
MRERARTLGGEIAIGPANPGNGTIVRVTVPCTAPASPETAL